MKWMLVVMAAIVLAVGVSASGPAPAVGPIIVEYPSEGSLFPPDIIAPTFQWRDAEPAATAWRIDITFADRTHSMQEWSQGEKMKLGELDTSLTGDVPPALTPEQEQEEGGAGQKEKSGETRHELTRIRPPSPYPRAGSVAHREAGPKALGG